MEAQMSSELEDIRDIRQWIETGQLDLAEIEVQLDWIIENGLAIIDKVLEEKGPEQALADFTLLNAFLSAAASQKSSLVGKLSSQVSKFKSTAESVGKKLKADSVSIAVGFPWGVSIDLSWNI
jgi:hypothetical protein